MKTVEAKYFIDNDETEILDIKEIILNAELQVRNSLDKKLVKSYSRAMSNGTSFPPITVAKIDDRLFLIDGFHRVNAALDLNLREIPALVESISFREAKVHASLANLKNAKPLNKTEKKNAFKLFIRGGGYKNKNGKVLSYRELAAELYGLASPATIHRWMWKEFPTVAEKMACESPTGNLNSEPQWLEKIDKQHLNNAIEAIRNVSNSFKSLEDLWYRYRIHELVRNLELELSRYPMQEPEF